MVLFLVNKKKQDKKRLEREKERKRLEMVEQNSFLPLEEARRPFMRGAD